MKNPPIVCVPLLPEPALWEQMPSPGMQWRTASCTADANGIFDVHGPLEDHNPLSNQTFRILDLRKYDDNSYAVRILGWRTWEDAMTYTSLQDAVDHMAALTWMGETGERRLRCETP